MTTDRKQPVHDIRLGRIKAAIWENDSENGIRHNVTFSRIYKDGNDWKDSTSFGRDDLLVLAKVADQANTWIFKHGNGSSNGGGSKEQSGDDSL